MTSRLYQLVRWRSYVRGFALVKRRVKDGLGPCGAHVARDVCRAILWLGVRDTTAGFVCYKRHVLEKLALDEVRFIGYAFQIEMKYRVRLAGFKIKEVPITFIDRVKGKSKMNSGIFKEAIIGVLQMRMGLKR